MALKVYIVVRRDLLCGQRKGKCKQGFIWWKYNKPLYWFDYPDTTMKFPDCHLDKRSALPDGSLVSEHIETIVAVYLVLMFFFYSGFVYLFLFAQVFFLKGC